MFNDENEITLAELQLKTEAVISHFKSQLEDRQNRIVLVAAALITAAAVGYWLGHRR